MSQKKISYLAVPYSHPDRATRIYRFEKANQITGDLMRSGIPVYSPISHTHPICEAMGDVPFTWDYWEAYDRLFIENSDLLYVAMLDGWQESKGVQAEIQIAQELEIPIKYLIVK